MLPYEILDVPLDADDRAIESAYRRLVVKFPPESHPETFQKIRNAYEAIAGEDGRLRRRMGLDPDLKRDYRDSPLEAAQAWLREVPLPQPPTERDFYRFLRS